ncbi:nuclear transport factor 2 family protein [Cloacibacterium sp. TD35]|uniref:nuclear transport factor 2 family protein n=1 Tax=Cloacibacterium sp. TD35 TaxID=2976818 RepID=UPI00237DF42C|nr:nuclear transport factor 2 family protein [Cloacibacterium sp. TD35]WDT67256.1 nuclear transport factor 2 family protein [Cloacibacterium sp. TD35]
MKKILLFIAMTSLFSCKQSEEKMVSIKETSSENEKIVKQLFVHFNNHDWEKMADLYTENPEFKEPTSGMKPHVKSRNQIVKEYTELQKQIPDVNDSLIAVYPSGKDKVIVEFIASGTLPDKSKYQLPICTIFTIENGKITKDYTYFDNSQN